MATTYSTRDVGRRGRCDDCGANADHAFQADTAEGDGTGYRGDLMLCRACLKAREAAGKFPFLRGRNFAGGN